MKKLLQRFLLAPLDLILAVRLGVELRKHSSGQRIYIFDFDNTLARTAQLIAKQNSYKYAISDLSLYESMQRSLLTRQSRGSPCLVLSARPRSDRVFISKKLASAGIHVSVEVVSSHWLKAITLVFFCMFNKITVTLVDDMMRGEETGNPRHLFFPRYMLSSRIRLITHEIVMRIR